MADETVPDNAKYDGLRPGQILADSSVADFIGEMGIAISNAQLALDTNSINQLAILADTDTPLGQKNLLELGFTPAFYHYQYADLAVSMQLRLQVGKAFGLGVQAGFKYDNTNSADTSSNDQNASSQNVSVGGDVEIGTLKFKVKGDSDDSVEVNGKDIPVTGDDPKEKAKNLNNALMNDPDNKIELSVATPPTPASFTITTNEPSPEKKIKFGPNTITFIGEITNSDLGLIQIQDPATTNTFTMKSGQTVTQTANASITTPKAYADEVATKLKALSDYDAFAIHLTEPAFTLNFKTSESDLESFSLNGTDFNEDFTNRIRRFVQLIKALPAAQAVKLEVEGFADRQAYVDKTSANSNLMNKNLSVARAEEVAKLLKANGMDDADLTISGEGNKVAGDHHLSNAAAPADDINFRKVEIRVKDGVGSWVVVHGDLTAGDLDPDLRSSQTVGSNGFVAAVFGLNLATLNGKTVTVDTETFTLSGAAAGGFDPNSSEAFALNLKNTVNTHSTLIRASATGNVVTLYKNDDEFTITMGSDGSAEITISGKGKVKVTANFSKSSSSVNTNKTEQKSTVAFGASVDVRYARKFDMAVTGNSSIRARLVSVPAPPEFLDEIQTYMEDLGLDSPNSATDPTNPPGTPILSGDPSTQPNGGTTNPLIPGGGGGTGGGN